MKSEIGLKRSHADPETPYVTYSWGVKEEGQMPNAFFTSKDLAMNALMQTLLDTVEEARAKYLNTLVWRKFPEVTTTFLENGAEVYFATARWCFK